MRVTPAVTATLLVCGLLAAGCSGDDSGAGPVGSASSQPSGQPSSQPSSSDEPGTETPTSDPGAATGKLIELDGLSFRLPEDFTVVRQGQQVFNSRGPSITPSRLDVVVNDNIGNSYSPRQLSREFLRFSGYTRDPEPQEPVVVDGSTMFHLAGMIDSTQYVEAFGTGAGEFTSSFEFRFFPDVTAAQRKRLTESVLATVDFE